MKIDFMDLLYYLKDLKMLYLNLWFLGKLIQNLLHKKWVWRLWESCEYIGYFKSFCETTWNWTMFWFHVNCKLFIFLPLDCDMWLSGDYLARYYSLCDIGILAPVFVMVISSGFELADEFQLCFGDEFQLCVGRLVLALCMSFGFVSVRVMWP